MGLTMGVLAGAESWAQLPSEDSESLGSLEGGECWAEGCRPTDGAMGNAG